MKCFNCKKELPAGSQFCSYCGENQGFSQEMLDAARAGDQDAIAELYSRTYESVYHTVRALIRDEDTVLDLVQDTFVKAFQHLDKLQDPNKFRAWVKRIGHNLAVDHTRRAKPLLFSQMSEEDSERVLNFEDQRPENSPELVLDRRETSRLVNEILGCLSDDQRLVVGMYYYEQRSVREIAQELGVSENTVKSRLFQGRGKIENRVRALEAQGTKLYSLTPTAFLLALLRRAEDFVPAVPADQMLGGITRAVAQSVSRNMAPGADAVGNITRELTQTTARNAAQSGARAAARTTVRTAAETTARSAGGSAAKAAGVSAAKSAGAAAAKGAAVKIIALITSAAVVIGGGSYVVNEAVQNSRENSPLVEEVQPGASLTLSEGEEIVPADQAEPAREPLTLDHMEVLVRGDMQVQYPVFRGSRSGEVNALALDYASGMFEGWDAFYGSAYGGSYRCAVTLLNQKTLSAVFWGETCAEGAISSREGIRTLNLDLETLSAFTLANVYRIGDPGLLETAYAEGRYPGEPETACSGEEEFQQRFDELRQIRGLNENFPYAIGFFKPEGVVLSVYDEFFAYCDHFELLLPYEALEPYRTGALDLTEPEPEGEPLTLDHFETMRLENMAVEYPVFRGRGAETVNDLVSARSTELCTIQYDDIPQFSLSGEYSCAVTLLNDRVLSLVFWGWSYIEGGIHPWTDLFPMNLDLQSLESFQLSDLFRMDDPGFISACYAWGRYPGEPETCYSEDMYPEAFAQERDTAHCLQYASDGFLKPEGVVVTCSAMHFTGSDHIEILVPFEALRDYYIGPYDPAELFGDRAEQNGLDPALCQAYLRQLASREEDIRYMASKNGASGMRNVAVCDVTGDGVPELLYITSQQGAGGAFLWIYRYENGQAVKSAQLTWEPEAGTDIARCLFRRENDPDLYLLTAGGAGGGWTTAVLRLQPQADGSFSQYTFIRQAVYASGHYPDFFYDVKAYNEAEFYPLVRNFYSSVSQVVLFDLRLSEGETADGRTFTGIEGDLTGCPCEAMTYDRAAAYLKG